MAKAQQTQVEPIKQKPLVRPEILAYSEPKEKIIHKSSF
jgi:hypothetical protein